VLSIVIPVKKREVDRDGRQLGFVFPAACRAAPVCLSDLDVLPG